MQKLFRAFAHAACLAGAMLVSACAEPLPAPGPATDASGPALWRLADEDTTIWLFGTVHILPPDLDWRSARVDAAFASSDALIVETDTSTRAQQRISALVQLHGMLPAGETLAQRTDSATMTRLGRVAGALEMDAQTLSRMRPWLAAMQVSLAFALNEGHSTEAGVEQVLMRAAAAQGKPVSYLETAEQQITALAGLSPAQEARFLAMSLEQIEEEPDALDDIDAAWASGDTDALLGLTEPRMRETGAGFYAALITDRNAAWTEVLVSRLEAPGVVFVAVGAAHLGGPDSVVAMLRARGYSVEGP
jgi:uncharacterized protein YbaP (TraB family)